MVILALQKISSPIIPLMSMKNEVRNIIEVCREYAARFNKEIPVVLAGGISTKEAADHAFR